MLYGQLHEGLRYEVMKAPGVSGVDSYSALCIAAQSEERRLQELRGSSTTRCPLVVGHLLDPLCQVRMLAALAVVPLRGMVAVGVVLRSARASCVTSWDT